MYLSINEDEIKYKLVRREIPNNRLLASHIPIKYILYILYLIDGTLQGGYKILRLKISHIYIYNLWEI